MTAFFDLSHASTFAIRERRRAVRRWMRVAGLAMMFAALVGCAICAIAVVVIWCAPLFCGVFM